MSNFSCLASKISNISNMMLRWEQVSRRRRERKKTLLLKKKENLWNLSGGNVNHEAHEYSCLQKSNDGERMGYKSEWNKYPFLPTFPRMEKFNMSSLAMNIFRESCGSV